jgi:hypothetical protein
LLGDEDEDGKEKDQSNPDFDMGEADPEKEVGNTTEGQSQPPSQQPRNLNQKQASLFQEALDLACDKLFDEISIKVMLEPADELTKKHFSPLTHEELDVYNTLVHPTAQVPPSEVFFAPSPDPQVAAPHNLLQGGNPSSPATSSADIGSSPGSGAAEAGVLPGEVGVGGALYATTSALAASTDSTSADAPASIVSNMGAADGAAGNAADFLLGATAAPGGVCAAPAPSSPDTSTGDSPVELAGSTTLEDVDRDTAV